jgi:nitroreductase
MDILEAIRHLRVVRDYDDRPIEAQVLRTIVDAGRHTGSSKNLQRWDFIVVTDRSTIRDLGAVGRYAGHLPSAAAVIALVTPDPEVPRAPLSIAWDLGRAAQDIVLAAWSLGVGSCPVTVYDHDLARGLLGYPPDYRCAYLVTLGYPRDPSDLTRPPRPGGRKTLAEVLHLERW